MGKLEISLVVLNNDDLLKKLNESTIDIQTVEIQPTCKLEQVLVNYSLPPCLEVLRISDNTLDVEDIFYLIRSLTNMKGLHELDLCCTKFTESSFNCFLTVLIKCSDLRRLCLNDNGLTKQDVNCLITAFESLKNLKNLKLSKNNLTETQANDIFQKYGEGKSIVSLDLSQNAIQGNEIIVRICKLDSLEELNLSHNHIRFHPLPSLDEGSDNFPINTKIISLSSNRMTPNDICRFLSLIRSDLQKLHLDFNHVGNSIWSLCSLRIFKHLKVLSLANTDICGPAVEGLADLLSSVTELEELNLSSNNLMLEDFRNLQSHLSNLTQLKKLNLSNNNLDGITVILQGILPSLKYLEELRLSNVNLNGGDCKELFKGFLVQLNKLRHLNLSGNQIDIEIIDEALLLPPNLQEVILSDIIHGGKLFVNMIQLQRRLKKLYLCKIKLGPSDLDTLAAMLSSFRLLQELALTDVDVADRNCENIFSAIKLLKNLKKLDLGGMKVNNGKVFIEILSSFLFLEEIVFPDVLIHDDGVTGFFYALRSLRYLKKLDLGLSTITQAGDVTLADVLPSLQLLEKLVVGNIRFDDECQKHLFPAVGKLKYLKELDFGWSTITQTGAVTLADVLPSLQLLEKLVLRKIVFDDECQKHLFHAVGKLKYLRELDLGFCEFTQTGPVALADVLPSLQLLEKLVMQYFSFDDECQKHLFHAVGKLKYLKELDFGRSTITQTAAVTLADVLPSLQLLEKLVLKEIVFDDEWQKHLFHAVGKLKYLKELDVGRSTITQTGSVTLADVLPSLQLLEKLVLRNNVFDDECQKHLFHAVGKLKYLKELDLGYSKITQTGAVTLAEVLPSLQLLEKLMLDHIEFDDECQKHLFHAVGKLTYLKELDFESSEITQTGAVTLAEVLPSLQLLEMLVLGSIKFDDEWPKHLFHAVGKLKYLKELDFGWSTIIQTGAVTLAEVLPSLQLLEKLVLDDIEFDDECQKHLFHAVGKLTYLEELDFGSSEITQTGAVTLAEVLPSLQLLEMLVLGSIKFDDECQKHFFHAVGKLKYLKYLHLGHSEITLAGAATLTDVLPTLRNLRLIWLSKIESDETEISSDEESEENEISSDEESEENETSSDEESEGNETPKSKLEAAARLVPGLSILWV